MKKRDFKVILFLIICVILMFVAWRKPAWDGASNVIIRQNGIVLGTYSLATDRLLSFNNNTVVIKNNSVSIQEADCPDKLCVHSGSIESPGQSLVCLPNKFTVEITNSTIAASSTSIRLGTAVSIAIYTPLDNAEAILAEALRLIDSYELIYSATNPDSELYKLNHRLIPADSEGFIPVSKELFNMLQLGLAISEESDGVFDIAIGAITNAWGFHDSNNPSIPDKQFLTEALSYSNTECFNIGRNSSISFSNPNTQIDLGGIAKGYIGEKVKELFLEKGVDNAIINLGGDTLTIGGPFRIGIQRPFSSTGETAKILEIANSTVVTSGVYERMFVVDGTLYHHLIDPSTGYPFISNVTSMTIIGEEGSRADFLATYLLSMGKEKALAYAKAQSIKAIIIDNQGELVSSY